MTVIPAGDDSGTTGGPGRMTAALCPSCAKRFVPVGRQLYCSTACRKRAFRRRHARQVRPVVPPGGRRDHSVYECGACGQRRLGEQRCEDCGVFAHSVGLGGPCPSCAEPVTLADLDLRVRQ